MEENGYLNVGIIYLLTKKPFIPAVARLFYSDPGARQPPRMVRHSVLVITRYGNYTGFGRWWITPRAYTVHFSEEEYLAKIRPSPYE
jgi:hypothetical protein